MTLIEARQVSGDDGGTGHLEELRRDPIGLMQRVRAECGDVGRFRLADRDVVLVSGAEANEWFFRSPEEDLDQAEAYPFMTPIFGEGVVFDASPERRRESLHNMALRDKQMRGHAETIAGEVDRMVSAWAAGGGAGEIDLLDWFAELTIYTSSACLIGSRFREQLDPRFAALYHDLEKGTDAIAYVDPYADIESFHRRDAARVGLVALVQAIMDERTADPSPEDGRDLLDVLMSLKLDDGSARFEADEVTGMFISMMFAGHHTTSGTAA
ncbi:MAG TPA: cytochrome P450, partial [Acidimicrobiales bacterium]